MYFHTKIQKLKDSKNEMSVCEAGKTHRHGGCSSAANIVGLEFALLQFLAIVTCCATVVIVSCCHALII